MRYRRYWNNQPSRMTELVSMLGPMVNEVKKAFFGLNQSDLNKLFDVYSQKNGVAAANYARNAMARWKSGATSMSGKTAEKILNLVPSFMPLSKRHDMVVELCNKYHNTRNTSIEINLIDPSPGIQAFHASVDMYKNVENIKHLPEQAIRTLKWLANDDITALRAILAEVDKVTSVKVSNIAKVEFEHLSRLVKSDNKTSGNYMINFPNGTLTVIFKQPSLIRRMINNFF